MNRKQIHTASHPHWTCTTVLGSLYTVSRWIQSSTLSEVRQRRTRTKFGEHCFSHAGPAAWNSLSDSSKHTADINLVNTASVTLVQLPGIPYPTVLNIPLILTYLKVFQRLVISPCDLTFLASWIFWKSRSINCICIRRLGKYIRNWERWHSVEQYGDCCLKAALGQKTSVMYSWKPWSWLQDLWPRPWELHWQQAVWPPGSADTVCPRPSVTMTFDCLTLKLVCESHLRWETFTPNLAC